MSQEDAARFIANNTTDRRAAINARQVQRTANIKSGKYIPGSPNYEPFLCALCEKDIRIAGTAHGDGNHYSTHTSNIDGKPVINAAGMSLRSNPPSTKRKGRG